MQPVKLQDILEPDESVGPEYDVTQPSILEAIGKKGIRRTTVLTDCCYTITCRQDRTPAQVVQRPDGRYRYLTEKECFRAQGIPDLFFEKAKSVTPKRGRFRMPLYKQAGNSMPVPVLESIFKEIFDNYLDE